MDWRKAWADGRPGIVLVSGLAGAAASCAPVGSPLADAVVTGAFAAAVAAAGAAASPAALAWGGVVLVAFGGSIVLRAVGLAVVVSAATLGRRDRRSPVAAAAIATVVVQAALRLPYASPTRASSVVAALALAPVALTALRAASPRRRRRVRNVCIAGVFVVVGIGALAAYATLRTRQLVLDAERHARHGVDAARAGDREQAAGEFDAAGRDFHESASLTGAWWTWPARHVPLLAPQIGTLDRVAHIGAHALDVASSAARTVDPERLRMVDGRIDLAAVAAFQPSFDEVASVTRRATDALGSISRVWLVPPLDDALARFERTMRTSADSAATADEAVRLAPKLLGGDRTRNYLLLFVTPAEARASGGFIANYGVLRASNGRVHLEDLGRVRSLDLAGLPRKHLDGPADYVARYGPFDVANTWENVTMSPDFPSVANAAAQLFPQSGGVPVDGVIRVDPVALSHLLAITGPVHVPGIDHAIDADNVVSFLLRDQYTLDISLDERIDVLADIARVTFDQLTHGRGATPSALAEELSPAVEGTNLALWFTDPTAQRFAQRIGADAAVAPVRGDGLGVITQNAGASKIDAYLRRSIAYSATIDPDTGRVNATATITLRNDAPARGLPDYVIGNSVGAPRGTNRSYVSVYSPLALLGAAVDGHPISPHGERELGRNVYSEFVDIPAGATRTMTLRLAGAIDLSAGAYDFDYFGQVLPNADTLTVRARLDGRAHFGHQEHDAEVRCPVAPVAWSISMAMQR